MIRKRIKWMQLLRTLGVTKLNALSEIVNKKTIARYDSRDVHDQDINCK